jgi:hypothetical protein
MVDISEEVAGAETAASGPVSISEQNSQLSAATRHGMEAETVNKQASAIERTGPFIKWNLNCSVG